MASTDLSADARSGPRRRWLKSLLRSPVGLLGVILVGAAVLMAVGAPLIAPLSPMEFNFRSRLLPPSWLGGEPGFFLGTDQLGRDLLSRLIFGARISLLVGVLGVLISLLIGVTLGLISGYVGGLIDSFISRVIDTFMAIPFILLALAVVGVVGTSGGNSLTILVVVLGLTGWVTFARVVRGEVLSVKNLEYVEAANALGQRDFLVIFRHVLPNVTASIIVLATLQIATVIIAESSLSFLGLGVQPPTVTWGIMLADGRDHLATSWWLSTFPGIAITLTTLGMILLGDWLRDVLDPRMVT
ncbi:MAG: ABC transporter permease [Truepera sp.]|nr:ABC transporter permease [Truepera sp.]